VKPYRKYPVGFEGRGYWIILNWRPLLMMRNGLRYSRNACQKLISGYTSCLQKI